MNGLLTGAYAFWDEKYLLYLEIGGSYAYDWEGELFNKDPYVHAHALNEPTRTSLDGFFKVSYLGFTKIEWLDLGGRGGLGMSLTLLSNSSSSMIVTSSLKSTFFLTLWLLYLAGLSWLSGRTSIHCLF